MKVDFNFAPSCGATIRIRLRGTNRTVAAGGGVQFVVEVVEIK